MYHDSKLASTGSSNKLIWPLGIYILLPAWEYHTLQYLHEYVCKLNIPC